MSGMNLSHNDARSQAAHPQLLTNKRQGPEWINSSYMDEVEHKHSVHQKQAKSARKRRRVCDRKVFLATMVPWLIFVLCGFVCILFFHHHISSLTCVALTMSCLFLVGIGASRNIADARTRIRVGHMMALCLLATVLGCLNGYYSYITVVSRFWEYYEHRRYTNVMPDELAAAHMDASAIVFAEGTHPDTTRPVGYKVGHTTYCVAPVTIRNVALVTPDIQYWAIGKDCCHQRSRFTCGDSKSQKAHAGLVQHDPIFNFDVERVRDMMYFRQATTVAEAAYGFTSSKSAILVRWVTDIEDGLHDIFRKAWLNLLQSCAFYFLLSLFFAFQSRGQDEDDDADKVAA